MEQNSYSPFCAFNYSLEPAGLNSFKDFKLKKFIKQTEPNYISRNVFGGIVSTTINSPETIQAVYENYMRIGQEKASHLQHIKQFGIKLPPTYFTAGSNEQGYLNLYSLTQLVDGPNLLEYTHNNEISEEILEQKYTHLLESLCNYYAHCFKKQKSVLFDTFGLQQFVMSRSDNEIYLVDTDSELMEPSQNLANYLVKQLTKSNSIIASKFQNGSNRMYQANENICRLDKSISTQ